MVACAAASDVRIALGKVIRDLTCIWPSVKRGGIGPGLPSDCVKPLDGAIYMARPDRANRFSFLGQTTAPTLLSTLASKRLVNTGARELVNMLAEHGCDVIAVDITSLEALALGLHVVKVIIPQLIPMSLNHNARYLAHPRLANATKAFGVPGLLDDINDDPQPFA
jgi:ribosomal protein S12 methylthiotransferase accessory factor